MSTDLNVVMDTVTYGIHSVPTNNVGRVKYGLAEGDVVLAYFGQIYKIDSSVFAVWVRVLRRVARAKLWLFHFPIQGYIYIYIYIYIHIYIHIYKPPKYS